MRFLLLLSLLGSPAMASRSVYDISLVDIPVIAGSSLATLVPYAFQSKWIKKRCPCDPNEVNGFDRGAIGNHSNTAATLTDVVVGLSFVAPVAVDYAVLGWSREFQEDAVVFAETLSVAAGLVSVVKVIVQRPVPRSYEGDLEVTSREEGYRSFYSGHATMAFSALTAAAMTAHYRYGFSVVPWAITLVAGGGVAVGRVAAGVHFPSDVLVGAAVGTAIGVVVPWWHRKASPLVGNVALLPLTDGAKVVWSTKF